MSKNIAINGYGRIGQSVLRAIYEAPDRLGVRVCAINSLTDLDTLTYMTRYDTTFGRFPVPVEHDGTHLIVNGDKIRFLSCADPAHLDWQDLDLDLIMECSGSFTDRETAEAYVKSGARALMFSQPAQPDVDATVVFGINQDDLKPHHTVMSAASCTTNCVVPVLDILHKRFGVESGVMTTIHSAMNDQPMIDSSNAPNLRLSRSGLQSIIPVTTGLAKGIERLLPELSGRFECLHVRVPTMNVSALDISLNLSQTTTVDEINALFKQQAEGRFKGLLAVVNEPHASIDFNHDAHSCIIDATQTRVSQGHLVKLFCWFDNEWGYANRLLDTARYWLNL